MNWQDFPDLGYGGQVKYITMADGTRLRTAAWPSAEGCRGIVILVNGHREYMEKQAEFMAEFLDRNYALYSFDHRGQGLSDRLISNRMKSYAEDFGLFSDDLNIFVSQSVMADPRAGELPVYLIGHSMGGHICLRYLHDYPGKIDKAILMAPMIDINLGSDIAAPAIKKMIGLANMIGLGKKFAFGQGHIFTRGAHLLRQKLLTHDQERYVTEAEIIIAHPDLYVGGATFGWLGAALDSIEEIRKPGYLDRVTMPVLVILAGADKVVKNSSSRALFAGHGNMKIVTIEGARHEIYRETDKYRLQLWQEIEEFLGLDFKD